MAALPTSVACADTDGSSDECEAELFVPNRPSNFLDAQWYQQLVDGADLPSPQVLSTDAGLAAAGMGTLHTPNLQHMAAACMDPVVLQAHGHHAELAGNDAGSDSSSTQTSSIDTSHSNSRSGSHCIGGMSSCSQPAGSTATVDAAHHVSSQRRSNDSSGGADATADDDVADASTSNRTADSSSRLGSRSNHSWGSRSTAGSDSSGGSSGSKSSSGIDVLSLDSLPAEDDLEDLLQRLQAGTAQLGGGMAVGSPDVLPFADTEQLVSPRPTASSKGATKEHASVAKHQHLAKQMEGVRLNARAAPSTQEQHSLKAWHHSMGLQENVAVLVRPTVFVDLRQDHSSSANSGRSSSSVMVGAADSKAVAGRAALAHQGSGQQGLWASDSESDDEDWWALRQQMRCSR